MDKLPEITINGQSLSAGEVKVLNVALQRFLGDLTVRKYPLGADETGAILVKSYKKQLNAINEKIMLNIE